MGTAVIGCILFIVLVFAVKSCCKRIARGCCGQEKSAKALEAADRSEEHYPYRKYLEVEGMFRMPFMRGRIAGAPSVCRKGLCGYG